MKLPLLVMGSHFCASKRLAYDRSFSFIPLIYNTIQLTKAVQKIKLNRHGVPIRIKTNGLIPSKEATSVASMLAESGVDHISINLAADNPKLYNTLMEPKEPLCFSDVCAFVIACSETGLTVDCSAIENPKANMSAVRSLAYSLGAESFSSSSYHP